jgi:hypothetical protein
LAALSRALATLGYDNLYDLDTVANGSPDHAAFWVRAVERKLSGQPGFDSAEAVAFFDGYHVGARWTHACSWKHTGYGKQERKRRVEG